MQNIEGRPEYEKEPRPKRESHPSGDWAATVGIVCSLIVILGFILLMVKL